MKITIVGQYFWPDNFLINEISEELVKKGHEVTVLTGLPDYSTSYIPKEYKYGKRRIEEHNGVKIIRVPIIARHHGFIFRVFNYLSFFINSSIYAYTHKIESDVIFDYQTAPVLMANAGIVFKKKLKKPLFLYCLDIWPDQMKVWNVYENNPLYKIVHKYCKYAYSSADILGVSSEPFRRYMIDINKVDKDKIVYLPQHSNALNIKESKKDTSTTNFIFAGNIGEQQNIESILEAVSLMDKTLDFKVNIYGDGTSFEKCKSYAKDLDVLDKVKFYGRVAKEELDDIYPKMDAFLLTLCSEKEIGFTANTVPAKFQGYLSAGKPIIAAIDGGARDIINEINCGSAVNSGDSKGLAENMTDFVLNPDKYEQCGENGIKYFNAEYEKTVVMDKIEKILEDLAKK